MEFLPWDKIQKLEAVSRIEYGKTLFSFDNQVLASFSFNGFKIRSTIFGLEKSRPSSKPLFTSIFCTLLVRDQNLACSVSLQEQLGNKNTIALSILREIGHWNYVKRPSDWQFSANKMELRRRALREKLATKEVRVKKEKPISQQHYYMWATLVGKNCRDFHESIVCWLKKNNLLLSREHTVRDVHWKKVSRISEQGDQSRNHYWKTNYMVDTRDDVS